MRAGRPRKYTTKKALFDAVERYFRSISRTRPALDQLGQRIQNDDGEDIVVLEYVVPPSVGSLCLYLGIDRSTWQNYCDAPELAPVTALARARIEAYLEEQLLTRSKGLQGIIFNLQNNYGWKQKSEVELGGETRRTVAAGNLSIREKLALIAEEMAMRDAAAVTCEGDGGEDE